MSNCKWAVVATCAASKFEPEFTRTIALFENPVSAQDFIEKCFPEETRDKFKIVHI